jgi:hypothetical protein
MTDHTPQITPTLESAVEIRADIHQAMIEVEEAISAAAPGRFLEWTAEVQKALTRLHYAFHHHIDAAEGGEGKQGLYDEILEREPRLRALVEKLMAEHPLILEAIHEPYHRLRDRKDDEYVPAEEIREEMTATLARITKHRQKGADLVYEAYYVDLGGMG